MDVSSLGISNARLPVLAGRRVAIPDAVPPVRKTTEAAPTERVYVGEYVAAGTGPSFFFRDDTFGVHPYGDGGAKTGNRKTMVQAYLEHAGPPPSGGRASGRIDYFV